MRYIIAAIAAVLLIGLIGCLPDPISIPKVSISIDPVGDYGVAEVAIRNDDNHTILVGEKVVPQTDGSLAVVVSAYLGPEICRVNLGQYSLADPKEVGQITLDGVNWLRTDEPLNVGDLVQLETGQKAQIRFDVVHHNAASLQKE